VKDTPIFVVGPPRSGSSMVAAAIFLCGAWGRLHRDVRSSGFHLSVVDSCLLAPHIADSGYLLNLAGTMLPGVPCPKEGLESPNFKGRFFGAVRTCGWQGGALVVRSHLLLPFIPSIARDIPEARFVFTERDPLEIERSTKHTGGTPLRNLDGFWRTYASRYNAEMLRFAEALGDRGCLYRPEAMARGNTIQIAEIATRLGLKWTAAAEAMVARISKPGRTV